MDILFPDELFIGKYPNAPLINRNFLTLLIEFYSNCRKIFK